MSRKPLHPTIYPPQTRASSIQAFASIIAKSAVRIAQSEENHGAIESDLKRKTVNQQTSVCYTENEKHSIFMTEEEDK
jgi:hypothetical protein